MFSQNFLLKTCRVAHTENNKKATNRLIFIKLIGGFCIAVND